MDFKQLQAFTEVAAAGSFSEAARTLYVSQPTVSAYIKDLEKELQAPLFYRTTKKVALTKEGEHFLPYARRILQLKETGKRILKEEESPAVMLGTSTIPSVSLLPPLLTAFREYSPKSRFEIRQSDSAEIEELVLERVVDVGFTGRICRDERIDCHALCTDTLVVAAPASEKYLDLRDRKVPAEKILTESPYIGRETGSATGQTAARILSGMEIREEDLQVAVRTNDLESMKQMILCGLGVSVLSERSVRTLAAEGKLLLFPLPEKLSREFYMLVRTGSSLPEPAGRFVKFVREKGKEILKFA